MNIRIRRARTLLFSVGLAAALSAPAAAYMGSLSSPIGVQGSGEWIDPGPTTIDWTVTQNPDGTWHYEYTFTHPQGETSYFLLEVSPEFTADDILNAQGDFDSYEVGDFGDEGGSNPGIPGVIHAIKFDGATGLTTFISFDSPRQPVWGDFYSKNGIAGGEWNAAWNAGFTEPDSDPSDPAGDGSIAYHILVPDTEVGVPVQTTTWGRIRALYR